MWKAYLGMSGWCQPGPLLLNREFLTSNALESLYLLAPSTHLPDIWSPGVMPLGPHTSQRNSMAAFTFTCLGMDEGQHCPIIHTHKMLVSLTVGKVDAGVAVLLTEDKRLVCSHIEAALVVAITRQETSCILSVVTTTDRVPLDPSPSRHLVGLNRRHQRSPQL